MGRVDALSAEHTHCRDYGHTWKPRTAKKVPQRRRYIVTIVCGSCDTLRHRILTFSGEVVANRYTYPEGYRIPGGRLEQQERDAIRLRSIISLLEGTS